LSARLRLRGAAVGAVLLGVAAPLASLTTAAAAAEAPIQSAREGSAERLLVNLDGVLLGAVAPESSGAANGLLLLVRPARDPRGARRLLRLRLEPEPRLERLADGLDGALEGLVAVERATVDGAPASARLLATGPGLLVDLGTVADLAAESPAAIVARPLSTDPSFDPASLSPPTVRRGVERRLAAVAPGKLWIWGGSADAAAVAREIPLPATLARSRGGLRLSSPPVAEIGARPTSRGGAAVATFLVGPEPIGSGRLRALRLVVDIDAESDSGETAGARAELWASLPGPESVAQSWPFEIDGVPVVVVRTQGADELNLFERQRLRVLPLVEDRTRAGAPPTLAVELDSKRWHQTAIALGDVDGDGRVDLLAAFPEGLSGSDLVVQWWRGAGGGKFDPRARRTDLKEVRGGWALIAPAEAELGESARPGLLLADDRRIEWRPFLATGRAALAERAPLFGSIPSQAVPGAVDEGARSKRAVEVSVGSEGESTEVVNEDPAAEPLGGAELDGRPGLELLAIQGSGSGDERLIVLRRYAP
jgi:hypothetical protein